MNPSQGLDISRILNALHRQKDIAIAFALVVIILTGYLAASLPDIYRSSTLILVTPQRLPANYVASTVTSTIEQRMQAIAQQVLGRTMLEKVVKEFDLFRDTGSQLPIEGQVAMLRKRITLAINRNDTFSLSFDAEAPEDARRVTARLASLFIEENLKVREQQAAGTTSFINTEAERLRKELEDQEARVNKYRAQYWYELPENRDANSRALAQFQRELENGIYRITSLQDRKAALEKQLAESDVYERELVKLGNGGREQAALQSPQKIDRYRDLEDLLKKYSEKHPDVIRLKREIQAMGSAPVTVESSKPVTKPSDSTVTSLRAMLAGQISELNAEIAALQTKNNSLNAQISMLQSRVDNTPLRAIELSKITRDYDITLRKYQDLLGKSLESELSENMEKKQKGEQFQIVDPAHLPQKPVAPNRPRILLIGLMLALGGGVGAAFLLDNLDKSFKTNEDLVSHSSIPLLAVLPAVPTRGIVSERRQARMVLVLGSLAVLAIGLVLGPYLGTFLLYR